MTHHAVRGAISLYEGETLTLEQAAAYAGLAPEAFAGHCRRRGITLGDDRRTRGQPAVASD